MSKFEELFERVMDESKMADAAYDSASHIIDHLKKAGHNVTDEHHEAVHDWVSEHGSAKKHEDLEKFKSSDLHKKITGK